MVTRGDARLGQKMSKLKETGGEFGHGKSRI